MECNCSKERFAMGLKSLGKEEIELIIKEDGQAETVCQKCSKTYFFTLTELEELLEKFE